jgi:hypothetical protein
MESNLDARNSSESDLCSQFRRPVLDRASTASA